MDLNLFCIAVIDSTHISLIAKRKIKQLQPAYIFKNAYKQFVENSV